MMAAESLNQGMRLSELLDGLAVVPASDDVRISDVSIDSRRVQPGALFLACRGHRHDGRDYIAAALHAGAVAIAAEDTLPETLARQGIPAVAVPGLGQKIGGIAARFYGHPGHSLRVIGVTGTNGKTSVASYIAQALTDGPEHCGLFGTLGYGIYGDLQPGQTTTPDPVSLHRLLADLRDRGVRHTVMEVSSHALDQGRVNGVDFDIAVLTNLSRDHLDYHIDLAAYGAAKRRLFEWPGLRHGIINHDDAFGRELLAGHPDRFLGYSLESPRADLYARVRQPGRAQLQLDVNTPWGSGQLRANLSGRFNAANLLAALGVLCLLEIPFDEVLSRLTRVRPAPGRMQVLGGHGRPLVVIDYAHTPDALAQALAALREECRGRLWCVFGCGGDRDPGKRPLMGAAAEAHADMLVITSDNPRNEQPTAIIADIVAGLSAPARALIEPDRSHAIGRAVARAHADDIILVAGKGHENYQEISGIRHAFSDSQVVQACLQAPQ